jgi:hypothetical protein
VSPADRTPIELPNGKTLITLISQMYAENNYDCEGLGRHSRADSAEGLGLFVVTASTSEICAISACRLGTRPNRAAGDEILV